jgi:hypothetical protein
MATAIQAGQEAQKMSAAALRAATSTSNTEIVSLKSKIQRIHTRFVECRNKYNEVAADRNQLRRDRELSDSPIEAFVVDSDFRDDDESDSDILDQNKRRQRINRSNKKRKLAASIAAMKGHKKPKAADTT